MNLSTASLGLLALSADPALVKVAAKAVTQLFFPAHAGWCRLFGPFRIDPFHVKKHEKDYVYDTLAKYIQRYYEICGNGCFDGYLYIVEVLVDGKLTKVRRVFQSKRAGQRGEVTLDDRMALWHVLQHLKEELKIYLNPLFEERLRVRSIAESLHAENAGQSLVDVLTSLGDAETRGTQNELEAILRVRISLNDRDFIRKSVRAFYADKPFAPKITNNKVSAKGGIDTVVSRTKPQFDWTGSHCFQVAVICCAKPLNRRVAKRCKKARIRKARGSKGSNAVALAVADGGVVELTKLLGEIKNILFSADDIELRMPSMQRLKLLFDTPSTVAAVPEPTVDEVTSPRDEEETTGTDNLVSKPF